MAGRLSTLVLSALAIFVGLVTAQVDQTSNCPNTLAVYNPNLRTECTNETYFIVPIDKTLVQKAVPGYNLLPLPTSDKTLFPQGFPAGKHPVVLNTGLGSDIRMSVLQLPNSLFQGAIIVPYVDRLGDGKTPFRYSVKNYIGGFNGQDLQGVVPTGVGTLGGTVINLAAFVPNNQAYQQISASNPEYQAQVKQIILPNPISGPGVYPEAFDTDFFRSTASASPYPLKLFKQGINQPLILVNGLCQRNPVYFNETFTDIEYRKGKATVYGFPGGSDPLKGVYDGVYGFSGSGPQVGFNAQSCAAAAQSNDPTAF